MTERSKIPKSYRGDLSAREVAKFLRGLSRSFEDPRTGNPALARALSDIVSALEKRGSPFSKTISKSNGSRPKNDLPLSDEFVDIKLDKIEQILSQPNVPKLTLIALGQQRFGIPPSALMRLNIKQVIDKIQSSIRNEESLHIIARQARLSGANRSS